LELFLASVAVCNNILAFPPSLIIQCIEVGCIWRPFIICSKVGDLTLYYLKLETLKTMVTPRKINAILLNIKTNRPKLVIMCRYKLATYWQNFTEIYLTRVQILQKVLGGLLF